MRQVPVTEVAMLHRHVATVAQNGQTWYSEAFHDYKCSGRTQDMIGLEEKEEKWGPSFDIKIPICDVNGLKKAFFFSSSDYFG